MHPADDYESRYTVEHRILALGALPPSDVREPCSDSGEQDQCSHSKIDFPETRMGENRSPACVLSDQSRQPQSRFDNARDVPGIAERLCHYRTRVSLERPYGEAPAKKLDGQPIVDDPAACHQQRNERVGRIPEVDGDVKAVARRTVAVQRPEAHENPGGEDHDEDEECDELDDVRDALDGAGGGSVHCQRRAVLRRQRKSAEEAEDTMWMQTQIY